MKAVGIQLLSLVVVIVLWQRTGQYHDSRGTIG